MVLRMRRYIIGKMVYRFLYDAGSLNDGWTMQLEVLFTELPYG